MKTSMALWTVTGSDHSGFTVRAKTFREAEKKARRYPGFGKVARPILCVRLFHAARP